MRILLTGATGFIGSNLLNAWSSSHEVGIITRPTSDLSNPVFSQAAEQYIYDGSFKSMLEAFEAFKPEVVVHLASYYVYDNKPEEVHTLIESNLKIGAYLLEAMKLSGVKHLINTGTSFEHYGEKEESVVNLYAATKQAFGNLCKYYCDAGYLNAVTLKLFDTYGDGDERKKLLNLLKDIIKTKAELLLSPGEQIIDILHVNDVLNAYDIALNNVTSQGDGYREYGLSSGERCSLKELVELIERIAGEELNIKWGARPYRDREVMTPWENFEQLPGWEPKISLEEGLRRFFTS